MSEYEPLRLTAAADIQAAIDTAKPPTITGLAYSGGVMNVKGAGPVVIDLAGLAHNDPVPLLVDHEATLQGIAGSVHVNNDGRRLTLNGTLASSSEVAGRIKQLAAEGVRFELSVGVEGLESRRIEARQVVTVNGQTLKGPFKLVTRGRLFEISAVVAGADASTSVRIAAKRGAGMEQVTTTDVTSDRVKAKAEMERIKGIRTVTSKIVSKDKVDAIQAKAIADGKDQAWAESEVILEEIRAERPTAAGGPAIHSVIRLTNEEVIAAALLNRGGQSAIVEKEFDEQTQDAAHRYRGYSVPDLFRAVLAAEKGSYVTGTPTEIITAGISNITLTEALGNAVNKSVLAAYRETPATWKGFATVKSANNFHDHKSIRLSDIGQVTKVNPGADIKHGKLDESVFTWKVETFAKMVTVDRHALVNDDLSLLDEVGPTLGRMAMRGVNDHVWGETILGAPAGHFDAANGNYDTGGTSALSATSLSTALRKVRSQRDADGNDLDLLPMWLAVSPENETTARELLNSLEIARAADSPTGNALRDAVKLIVEPRLSNTTKWASTASTTHWFLFTSPADASVIVAYLDGVAVPRIEFFGLQHQVKNLYVSWRCFHDYGSAMGDPKAAYKSDGA